MKQSELGDKIMDLLIEASKEESGFEYINPHFLTTINMALYDYCGLENDDVDEFIRDMFGA